MADPSYIVDGVLTDGEAWVAIGSTTLTTDTANITFTSTDDGQVGDFPQYMDLVAIAYVRAAVAHNSRIGLLSINGSSTNADYDTQQLYGNGSAVTSAAVSSNYWFNTMIADNSDANVFSVAITTFFDINSGKFKSWVVQSASAMDGSGEVFLGAGSFLKQEPITSIKFYEDNGGGLKDESRIDLFGILPRMVA